LLACSRRYKMTHSSTRRPLILKSYGRVFIQILNYERILSEKKEIQNVREAGSKTYIRYYRFIDQLIEFNIRIKGKDTPPQTRSIRLFPLRWEMLRESLLSSGFSKVEHFGGISLDRYEPNKSNDLFVIATK
ncbi:MAG: hypothetical protein QME58_09745, partial [Bacteroidota bacterium]|nr:hypothetical protein [Bacteroidota bacterium]